MKNSMVCVAELVFVSDVVALNRSERLVVPGELDEAARLLMVKGPLTNVPQSAKSLPALVAQVTAPPPSIE